MPLSRVYVNGLPMKKSSVMGSTMKNYSDLKND